MTLHKTYIAAAVLAALAAVTSAPALADCEGCVEAIGAADRHITTATAQGSASIVQSIVSGTHSILEAMGNATDAIAKNASANTKTRGDDAQRIAQAQAKQEAAIKAQQSVADMSCSATSSTLSAPASAPRGSGSDFSTASSGLPDRLKKAINATGASTTPALPPDTDEQLSDLGVGSCEAFASSTGPRAALCQAAGVKTSDPAYPDADTRAATLLNGPQAAGQHTPIDQLTVPESGPARDARKSYLTNISDVTPPPAPTNDAARTPAFKAYLGALASYTAIESLARKPAQDWDAWTTRDPSTTAAVNAIAQDPATVDFLQKYAQAHGIKSYSDGVSPADLMNIEVERRAGNRNWVLKMAGADSEAKQAESLIMQALSLRLEFQRLRQEKQLAVLQGSILHALNQGPARERVDDLAAVANGGGVTTQAKGQ